jgi:hypothetical protein
MEYAATFRFFDSLNDFLSRANKDLPIRYQFHGNPSIKDAVEAIGVPHTEVDAIKVNQSYVDFSYTLHNNDHAEVFPLINIATLRSNALTPRLVYPLRFVADVHAGKLAKALRMLGFDTVYNNRYADEQLADIAEKEDRIVLTRDVGLLKYKKIKWGYWLRSQKTDEQLQEVVNRCDLAIMINPSVRCIECNGSIEPVEKEKILQKIPPKTAQFFDEFYQCKCCEKVYWKGSHYEHMVEKINKLYPPRHIET